MARYFNKNLKFIRQEKGISQQELANKIGTDRSTISRWENDEMDITISNALLIADFFNIPMEDLTGKDLTIRDNYDSFDELGILFDKNKKYLTESDKNIIKAIIEERKKEIDKELGEE